MKKNIKILCGLLIAIFLFSVFLLTKYIYAAPSISINTINGKNPPFNFSCSSNPLFNPVIITGSGTGKAPPGQIEHYKVQVDWGDGTVVNGLGTFTPSSGQGSFIFTFSAGPHSYASDGNYIIL